MRRFRFKGTEKDYLNSVCKNCLKKSEIYSFDFMIGSAFFENVLWYSERYPLDWEEVCEAENDGWISINDRLPEFGKGILIHLSNEFITVGYRSKSVSNGFSQKYSWQLYGDKDSDLLIKNGDVITHWMPLPKPPTK